MPSGAPCGASVASSRDVPPDAHTRSFRVRISAQGPMRAGDQDRHKVMKEFNLSTIPTTLDRLVAAQCKQRARFVMLVGQEPREGTCRATRH